jgi:hypothetical protein
MPRVFPLLAVLAILGSFAFAQNTSAQNTQNNGASQGSGKSKPSPIVAKLDQKSSRFDKHKKLQSATNNQSATSPYKAAGSTDMGTSKAASKPTAASPGSTENAESVPPAKPTINR